MPLNRTKLMQDAIESVCKLNMRELIMFNAQLAEHMQNIVQHNDLKKAHDNEKPN